MLKETPRQQNPLLQRHLHHPFIPEVAGRSGGSGEESDPWISMDPMGLSNDDVQWMNMDKLSISTNIEEQQDQQHQATNIEEQQMGKETTSGIAHR